MILPQKISEGKEKGYKQLRDRISQRCWDLEAGRLPSSCASEQFYQLEMSV